MVSQETNKFSQFHPKIEPRKKKKKSTIIQINSSPITRYLDHRVHKKHPHLKTTKENTKKPMIIFA
jgi:hypothetical protein